MSVNVLVNTAKGLDSNLGSLRLAQVAQVCINTMSRFYWLLNITI